MLTVGAEIVHVVVAASFSDATTSDALLLALKLTV
jgi:hypothetical protein